MQEMLTGNVGQYGRTFLVGITVYFSFVAFQRITGRRSLSKMNGFDFIVTVALGSVMANALMSPDVAALEAVFATGLLLALQWVITWASVRSDIFQRLIKNRPLLLVRNGELLKGQLVRARVTRSEIDQALRQNGVADLAAVRALVLETNGRMSVITSDAAGDSALTDFDL